jgi:hypothetical protein
MWSCARNIHAIFTIFHDIALFHAECVCLEFNKTVFRSTGMVTHSKVSMSMYFYVAFANGACLLIDPFCSLCTAMNTIKRWTFREFNELPHAFERRMGPSYEAGESYLKLFTQSSAITSLGRLLVFISGSLGAVLLTFAAVNDAILLHVKIGDWNLLWYVGMLGATYAIGKGLLPDPAIHPPYTRNLFSEMDKSLSKVATHTHYYPDVWKKRGWDALTQKAFQGMFTNKAKLFALELCSVILAPILLCTSLRKSADDICEHVQKLKMDVPGAGDMCGYSCFDFDSFQDESWESDRVDDSDEEKIGVGNLGTSLDTSISETVSSSPMESQSRPKARFGKMEKSLFSFKVRMLYFQMI